MPNPLIYKHFAVVAVAPNECLEIWRDGTETTYWCPRGGGYVHAVTPKCPGTLGGQVMIAYGKSTGSTLSVGDPEDDPQFLARVIARRALRYARARSRRHEWGSQWDVMMPREYDRAWSQDAAESEMDAWLVTRLERGVDGSSQSGPRPMTVTIESEFHSSRVNVRVAFDSQGEALLSNSQARRVRAELCGLTDCTCSGLWRAMAGDHEVAVIPNGDGSFVLDR